MNEAEHLAPSNVVPKKAKSRRGKGHKHSSNERARAATHDGSSLNVYQHDQFNGWVAGAFSHCTWHNLTSFYANNTTSIKAGSHTGFGSDGIGGSGEVYTIGAHGEVSNVGLYWNDRFEARARVCL